MITTNDLLLRIESQVGSNCASCRSRFFADQFICNSYSYVVLFDKGVQRRSGCMGVRNSLFWWPIASCMRGSLTCSTSSAKIMTSSSQGCSLQNDFAVSLAVGRGIMHQQGAFYVLAHPLVEHLHRGREHYVTFVNEDVTIGSWLLGVSCIGCSIRCVNFYCLHLLSPFLNR